MQVKGNISKQLEKLCPSTVLRTEQLDELFGASAPVVPSFTDALPGVPALCTTPVEIYGAVSRVLDFLTKFPSAPISIDLEGRLGGSRPKIDLLQLHIDAPDKDHHSITFVIDTLASKGYALRQTGASSIRSILENKQVFKVLHCCHGDASSLFVQYGIKLSGAFDTGIGDALLAGHSSNRGLSKVLRTYLSEEEATLTHKGSLVHVPELFAERPLPYNLFVYAYEDVTACNKLFWSQRRLLEERNLFELACALTDKRCPPLSLPPSAKLHEQPARIAIALTDTLSVVCLQNRETGIISLPSAEHIPNVIVKSQGKAAWHAVMGTPKSPVTLAVNARLQKPIRIRDYLLVTAPLPCACDLVLEEIRAGCPPSTLETYDILVKSCVDVSNPVCNLATEFKILFQQLQVNAERAAIRVNFCTSPFREEHNSPQSDVDPVEPGGSASHSEPSKPPLSGLDPSGVADPASHSDPPSSFVVVGQTLSNTRAALILHDGTSVYTLKHSEQHIKKFPKSGRYSLPSRPVDVGMPPREAAIKAFEELAGSALRRGGGWTTEDERQHTLLPSLARLLHSMEDDCVHVGCFGKTEYYSFKLPPDDPLQQYLANFFSAHRPVNGFRWIAKIGLKYDRFELLPLAYALPTASQQEPDTVTRVADRECQCRGRQNSCIWCSPPTEEECVQASSYGIKLNPGIDNGAEHIARHASIDSNLGEFDSMALVEALASGNERTPQALSTSTAPSLGQHSEIHSQAQWFQGDVDVPIPNLGEDVHFDALFEAAVLLSYSSLVASDEHPSTFAVDSAGTPPSSNMMPTRQQVLEEQRNHPALATLMDYLEAGPLASLPQDPSIRSSFLEEVTNYCLAKDGLLLRCGKGPGAPDRIVLPSLFHRSTFIAYHDRAGHLGIQRVLPLILHRFYWGTDTAMKASLSEHINHCQVCARSKISHHSKGQRHIVSNGEHPMDVVSVDAYKTGFPHQPVTEVASKSYFPSSEETPRKEFDTVVTFACQFSRLIVAAATRGDPSSEKVAELLVTEIIRVYSTPREIRSDRGSVFVSKAISALYKAFGIRMSASTAYHHRTVGLVERWHSTLRAILLSHRSATNDVQWHKYLPFFEIAFNSTVNATTGLSPFFIVHGRHPRLPNDPLDCAPQDREVTRDKDGIKAVDTTQLAAWVSQHLVRLAVTHDEVGKKLRVFALNRKRAFDLSHDVIAQFSPGDRVLLLKGSVIDKIHPKDEDPWMGPFTVQRRLPQDRYQLCDMKTKRMHDVVHIDRLRLWPNKLPVDDSTLLDTYAVERIVGHRVTKTADRDLDRPYGVPTLQYRIRWRGWPPSSDSWRSMEYLYDIFPLVKAYNARLRNATARDIENEYSALFQSRDDTSLPPLSEQAKSRRHFNHHARPASSAPLLNIPEDPPPVVSRPPPEMSQFLVGTRIQLLASGFGGTRLWNGTITKRVESFEGNDCKLSIRFDDQRYSRDFVYKFSKYRDSLQLLEDSENRPPTPNSIDPTPIIDSQGRSLRGRVSKNYKE